MRQMKHTLKAEQSQIQSTYFVVRQKSFSVNLQGYHPEHGKKIIR